MRADPIACDTAQLFRDHATDVCRWATRLLGSSSDAEDIVQEVFLTVHRQQSAVSQLRSPPAWLLQITRNLVRHAWRSRSRAARLAAACDRDELVAPTPDPLANLERRRAAAQLEAAVATLDARSRQVWWLTEVDGLPTAAVAALTGLALPTLRVRRFRARRQLARQLERPV
jgi:RNA polymerase sigma-70 factor (ECF subfamily)